MDQWGQETQIVAPSQPESLLHGTSGKGTVPKPHSLIHPSCQEVCTEGQAPTREGEGTGQVVVIITLLVSALMGLTSLTDE